ncbi:NlpC/P60 family protein [Ferirhizobium litorale]|uniref:TIGR02594 family protein n=1 Tax=Ferirhizobium litorale TaxID=2927786 RepID=A0AAE3U603_9HYPH|nr:TIGR02594 family protein [Fererhizobium litorale]MDI7924614.1 TIGR02594 family protein [Fererhizobium litorale]
MKTILDIQRRLAELGFSPGPLDGVMGAKTEAAIIAFKRSVGLEPRAYLGPITLEKLFGRQAGQGASGTGEPRWLTLARRYSGLKEIKGKNHAPEILDMWRVLGLPYRDDETAWCAAFVGFCLENAGITSTRSASARSYEKWGVRISEPKVGAVVTFWRGNPNGWSGHVGFIVGRDQAGNLMVLGGNQSDQVNIRPFDCGRVTGFFWPKGEALPDGSMPSLASDGKLSTNEA